MSLTNFTDRRPRGGDFAPMTAFAPARIDAEKQMQKSRAAAAMTVIRGLLDYGWLDKHPDLCARIERDMVSVRKEYEKRLSKEAPSDVTPDL